MEMLKLATILITLVLVPAVHPKSLFRRIRESQLHLVKETTPSSSLNDSETTVVVITHHTTLAPVTAAALQDHRTNETEPVAQADVAATSAALYHHHPDHHQTDNATELVQNVTKQPVEAAEQTSATFNTSEIPKGVTMKTLEKAEDETKSAVVIKSTPPPKPEEVSVQPTTGAVANKSTSVAAN